jgi:hypothetical protein
VAATARGVKDVVQAVGGRPGATLEGLARDNHHPLGETFHTQGALRFGDHVAKLSLAPVSTEVTALTGQPVATEGFSAMRDAVVEHFTTHGATYELLAQLCTDLAAMPVEDAAVPWDAQHSPHRPIATLRFLPQPAYGPARQAYGDDVLSFNPWNGVEAHRPLGQIMRIRRAAYERSSRYRHEMNARPRVEPASLDDIPD